MITLQTDLERFRGDIADVIRLFLPGETVTADEGGEVLRHFSEEVASTPQKGGEWRDTVSFRGLERTFVTPGAHGDELLVKRMRKRAAKKAVYYTLKELTGRTLPWGSLTGIRPTRLFYEALEMGLDMDGAKEYVERVYDVTPGRADLLSRIVTMQQGRRETGEKEFDLYIGIPFCTTRCAYCSFASGEIGNGKLVLPYAEALKKEIRDCAEMARSLSLNVRAAYMGGGTPTSLPAEVLEDILRTAMEAFPGAVEWTCEAGRPDTIDRDKLTRLKALGITRISVNPQTFNDETLRAIGRAHTGEDTVRAYELARSLGFEDINMDIIAALPGEKEADFSRTLDRVLALAPESVTVHALAIKHSSRLNESLHAAGRDHEAYCSAEEADSMITGARDRLISEGYMPYYLYRQKYMAGNLENVGYAREGKSCLYNIGNMEETSSVLALGAGSISKWLFPGRTLRIERAPNVRNIEEYIRRVDEMTARKRLLITGEAQ